MEKREDWKHEREEFEHGNGGVGERREKSGVAKGENEDEGAAL